VRPSRVNPNRDRLWPKTFGRRAVRELFGGVGMKNLSADFADFTDATESRKSQRMTFLKTFLSPCLGLSVTLALRWLEHFFSSCMPLPQW